MGFKNRLQKYKIFQYQARPPSNIFLSAYYFAFCILHLYALRKKNLLGIQFLYQNQLKVMKWLFSGTLNNVE